MTFACTEINSTHPNEAFAVLRIRSIDGEQCLPRWWMVCREGQRNMHRQQNYNDWNGISIYQKSPVTYNLPIKRIDFGGGQIFFVVL